MRSWYIWHLSWDAVSFASNASWDYLLVLLGEQATLNESHTMILTYDQFIMWGSTKCRNLCNWKEQLMFLFHTTGLAELHNMEMYNNCFVISSTFNKRSEYGNWSVIVFLCHGNKLYCTWTSESHRKFIIVYTQLLWTWNLLCIHLESSHILG